MSLEKVLSGLENGDAVTFNNSGGANATGTRELTVTTPSTEGTGVMFEDNSSVYMVREYKNELVLYEGDRESSTMPEQRYDVIETMEFVGE